MSRADGAAAVGTFQELVFEYSTGIDQLHNDGALMVQNPEAWWTARRKLDKWLLDRLQFGYVAKNAKQLVNTRPSTHGDRGDGLLGRAKQRSKHA